MDIDRLPGQSPIWLSILGSCSDFLSCLSRFRPSWNRPDRWPALPAKSQNQNSILGFLHWDAAQPDLEECLEAGRDFEWLRRPRSISLVHFKPSSGSRMPLVVLQCAVRYCRWPASRRSFNRDGAPLHLYWNWSCLDLVKKKMVKEARTLLKPFFKTFFHYLTNLLAKSF